MIDLLLLIPTSFERDHLLPKLARPEMQITASDINPTLNWRIELCGFGVVASAALATQWIQQFQPNRVILTGIAGAITPDLQLGSAVWFDNVVCDGIGVGDNTSFQSASTLGWMQIEAQERHGAVGDQLPLHCPLDSNACLVTVPSASADLEMARRRQRRVEAMIASPLNSPMAEDMEGFSVAVACHLSNVPLSILRGISNHAGDRNHDRWQIESAMASLATELSRVGIS